MNLQVTYLNRAGKHKLETGKGNKRNTKMHIESKVASKESTDFFFS